MNNADMDTLAGTIAALLAEGLPQDEAVAHFIRSTHGALSPSQLTALVAGNDDPQGASLAELLLFPGEETLQLLEPALAAAALDADGVAALASRLGALARQAVAVLPDGVRLPVPMDAEAIRRFVSRLHPTRTLPADVAALLTKRFGAPAALDLAVTARQAGPEWTPAGASFLRSVLSRLTGDTATALDTLTYVVRFLGTLSDKALPLPALIAHRRRLAAQLRRARQQEQAQAASNFETLAMTGARLPYLHAPDIFRELTLADAAILAATGRPAPDTAGTCVDMGIIEDADDLLAALDDQRD